MMRVWKQCTDEHRTTRKIGSVRQKVTSARNNCHLFRMEMNDPTSWGAQLMQLLPWTSYSSDMSPIVHVYCFVGRRLVRDLRFAASKDKPLPRI
ncbi:hypothetical protein TNCV_3888651 [Trichonephila clavipes]|nr:hypothetical protein TNCV_3888651 [Trichonephila clavipes]